MARIGRNRARLLAVVAFLAAAATGAAFLRLIETRRFESRRQTAVEIGTAHAFALARQVDAAVAIVREIAAASRSEDLTSSLHTWQGRGPLFGVAIAPSMTIAAVQPDLLNREIGVDLSDDPARKFEIAVIANESRSVVGPPVARTPLGTVLHVFAPIVLDGDTAGAVVGYLRMDDLLRAGGVSRLRNQGWEYRLWRRDAAGRLVTFARSTELTMPKPVRIPIEVSGAEWSLEIAPTLGWRSRTLLREGGIALLASLLIGLFAYDLLRRPEILEQEVEKRARKLLEANRRIVTEVEQRERAEEEARHEATHDRLTSLPNRVYLLDRIGRALQRGDRGPFPFGVLLINLDRFSAVNDGVGYTIGDTLLVSVARRLENCIRLGDVLARTAGDEFAILQLDVHEVTDVIRVASRCHQALEIPFEIEGHDLYVSCSVGISMSTTGYKRPEELLRDAGLAMDRARREGGGHHAVFDPEMHARAMTMMQVESSLRRGIEQGELRAFYQPIISLESGTILGFEALIRWSHEGRIVPPGAFLPVALASGLMVPLDRWILAEAARQAGLWRVRFPDAPPYISVNVSGKRLTDPALVDDVKAAILDNELDSSSLRIEITEGEMMVNPDEVILTLRKLRDLGISLLVDDFGTGYSSLSYLQTFPIDIVKIDQSFVRGMAENPKDEEIVRAIVQLAEILGLRSVAEGIETGIHLQYLRKLECTYGQGYLFSKPTDAAAAEALLASAPRW